MGDRVDTTRHHVFARRLAVAIALAACLVVTPLARAGSLDPTATAKYVGSYGLEVVVDGTSPAYVEDDSPTAEPAYSVRFYVRLTDLDMANGDEFELFTAATAAESPVLRLSIFHDGSAPRLRVSALSDGGAETSVVAEALLVDGWRAVALDWRASSAAGANDGRLDLWIDGVAQTGLAGLDSDTLRVDHVRWGAVGGIDAGTEGSLQLDEFESRRGGYIGLHPVFSDVPVGFIFQRWILAIYNAGVTAGCGPDVYCPDADASRGQMAVFLLKAKEGAEYAPDPCVTPTFGDVPCSYLFAPWIEELFARGITAGCGDGNYCPESSTTRGQMAVFLLKALEGSGYLPPACTTPTFADVPCSHLFARWIEELAARGITAGCGGGNYCPDSPVSRGQMAVFLSKTFSLPVPTLP